MTSDETARFQAHLATCETCQAQLAELAQVSMLFSESSLPSLRPLALEQIHQQVDRDITLHLHQRAEQGPLQLAKWLTGAAAVVLLFSTIQLVFLQGGLSGNLATTEQTPFFPSHTATSQTAPGLAWEVTTAMLNQENPAAPAASNEQSLAAWMISDLSASNIAPITQE